MTENKRIFFIKKAGLITGPFTVTKLKMMVYEGTLAGEDLFSTDKTAWRPVGRLFPETFPGMEEDIPESSEKGGADPEPSPVPVPIPVPIPGPAPNRIHAPVEKEAAERVSPWIRDAAALIVLPWEFETESALMRTGKGKLILEALILNLLPC